MTRDTTPDPTTRREREARVRLWHDDIRRPPDDTWTWARTNEAAQMILVQGRVVEISMDHDLGLHEADPDVIDADLQILPEGARPEEGWELVQWMIERDLLPERITIHSWNPVGARRMAQMFQAAGRSPVVRPFDLADRANEEAAQ